MSNPKTQASLPSSAVFSADLVPDPLLQRVGWIVSLLALLAGVVAILASSAPAWLRLPLLFAWCLQFLWLRNKPAPLRVRIFGNGDVFLQLADGSWRDGYVAQGTLILPGLAWIRVDGNIRYQGLFSGRTDTDHEWRRLQVIGRHFADL